MKEKCFAIVSKKGHIRLDSIRYSRSNCVEQFCLNQDESWKVLKKYGWNCKKIQVEVL